MEKKGFLRKDQIYHRIVNGQIVQRLSYIEYSSWEFSLQFSFEPLCCGNEYSTMFDGPRLCEVFPDIPSWEHEGNSDSINEYMKTALQATKEKLFPFFDSIINYDSYLEKTNLLYSLLVFGDETYMINLALGNYDLSIESRELLFRNRIAGNQKRWGTNHHRVPSTQRIFEQDCEEFYCVKRAIDNNDYEYIKQYIDNKEFKSLKSYIKSFFTSSQYDAFLKDGILPFSYVTIT